MNIYFYSYTLFSMHFSINYASNNVKQGGVENQDGHPQEGKKNYRKELERILIVFVSFF